jgi:hypothetical protein
MASTRAKPELRTVTVAIVRDGVEVQAMQSKLTAAGIESFLTSERSYAVKKSQDFRAQPIAPSSKEAGAVKVQVARSDVQRALSVLGAANGPVNLNSAIEVGRDKAGKVAPRLLKDRDPTVPIIVVVFILAAVLILSIS